MGELMKFSGIEKWKDVNLYIRTTLLLENHFLFLIIIQTRIG